jgi:hypothetical protein
MQIPLDFAASYPLAPGSKSPGTSEDAADAIREDAAVLRVLVLSALRKYGPMTPDETAKKLGRDILSVRPRFSELSKPQHGPAIERTGDKRTNKSGMKAAVWRVKQ